MPPHVVGPQPQQECKIMPATSWVIPYYAMYNRPIINYWHCFEVGHCFVQDNQMLQEALGRGEGPYLSLLAQIAKRSKDSQLLPAEPVKQQLQAHPQPPPLINKAQLSVTQQGAESAATILVSSDSQRDVQLHADVPVLSAGELTNIPHSSQLAGADSKLQLLQQETSSSCAETSTQACVDHKLNSNKHAPDTQHQQQQQQKQQQQQEEEGIPGSSKRYISVLPVAALS